MGTRPTLAGFLPRRLIRQIGTAGAALLTVLIFGGRLWAEGKDAAIVQLEQRLAATDGADRIAILNEIGLAICQSFPEEARRHALEAIDLAREHHDPEGEGIALKVLAVTRIIAGDQRAAVEHSQRALAIFESAGNRVEVGRVLNNIGIAYRMLNEYDRAVEYYSRALAIDRELGNRKGIARTLGNIANVHFDQSRYQEALAHHLEALAILRELEDPPALSSSFNNIGVVYYEMGDYQRALEYHLQALAIREQTGDSRGLAGSLFNIGNIHLELGQREKAMEGYRRYLAVAREIGDRVAEARAHNAIGGVRVELDDHPAAAEHFRLSLAIMEETGNRAGIADALDNLGLCQRASGDLEGALASHRRALEIREAIGEERGLAGTCNELGRVYSELGRPDDADRILRRGLEVAQRVGAREIVKDSYWRLYEAAAARRDDRRALEYLLRHTETKDELLGERTRDTIAELEVRYQAEASQREIALLEKENEIRRLAASRARLRANLMLVGLVLALLVLAWLVRRYHYLFAFWKRRSYVGSYRIEEQIGSGGMGIVYRATDVMSASTDVALKVIRDEHAADPTVRKRFLHEAAVVDQLDHPHVVKVHERGERDGRLFMAMELLEGPSLADLIDRGERLPLADCLHVMTQLAEVVARIHGRGVVHRDLKPDNVVLVERDGDPYFVKLLDFGLARTGSLTRLTQTGMIVGTLGYLPPEQITDQRFTAAGDVYALGAVFYQLLTLLPPFPGDTPVEVIQQILEVEPVPPRRLRPEIGAELDALVLEMLAKDPERRPAEREVISRLAGLELRRRGEMSAAEAPGRPAAR